MRVLRMTDLDLAGKRVFIRVDFNVPQDDAGNITEDTRIRASVPAIELALKSQGIELLRAKVGDRYVLEALHEQGWLLGGEGSGHLLVLDRHTTGDGIVAALQVLAAMKQQKKTLPQLLANITLFPQTLINVRFKPGYDWKSDGRLQDAIAQAEKTLTGTGRQRPLHRV